MKAMRKNNFWMIFTLIFIVAFVVLFTLAISSTPVDYIFSSFLTSEKQDVYRVILDLTFLNYFYLNDAKFTFFIGLFIITIFVNSHKTYKFLAIIAYVIFVLFVVYFIRIIVLYKRVIEEIVVGNKDIAWLKFNFVYYATIILIILATILNTRNFIFFNIKTEIKKKPTRIQLMSDTLEDYEKYYY